VLPFSSIEYFLLSFIFVVWVHIAKLYLKDFLSYDITLLITSFLFLIFYFPKPLHILIFIIYSYGIYILLQQFQVIRNKVLGSLLLILPMILAKVFEYNPIHCIFISELIFFPGLSYISFRLLSVYLDSNNQTASINIVSFLNYLLFIPTLLIGPIDRYDRFNSDEKSGYNRIGFKSIISGLNSLKIGILYKFIFAELINRYWLSTKTIESLNSLELIIDMYAYYLYLFFDFAGYSLMAIGLGKMLGINIPINFNKPFLSKNPQEFWTRFHKTLGDWLKDYFFIPFYKYFRTNNIFKPYKLLCENTSLFLTFFMMGCWNGLTKQYIISGSLFGVYSVIYNTYKFYNNKKKCDIFFGHLPQPVVKLLSIIIMINAVAFSLHIFSGRSPYF